MVDEIRQVLDRAEFTAKTSGMRMAALVMNSDNIERYSRYLHQNYRFDPGPYELWSAHISTYYADGLPIIQDDRVELGVVLTPRKQN